MLLISSTHGTGLRPQILGETYEGLVQTCIRHSSLLDWSLYRASMHHTTHITEGKLLVAQVSAACSQEPKGEFQLSCLSMKFSGAMIRRAPDSSSSLR